ncbi:TlpA family protein disulfide reductase [bacterium]|nr:MAG: TlpA family protein disulfide reductase [bacterium]
MKRSHLAIVLIILSLVTACGGGGGKGEIEKMDGGAPDFTLPSVDGSMVRLSDFQGKVIMVDFWATWCPPCQEMIPVLSQLHKRYSMKGLVILGISLDQEGLGVLGPYVYKNRIPYKVLLGNDQLKRGFGVVSIPTLFMIDREGRLVRKMMGYHSFGELESQLKKYL